MRVTNTYRIWLKLAVSHAYFDASQCGLLLEPTGNTKLLLQKAAILFKQQNPCSWILVSEDFVDLEAGTRLEFQLKAQQADFYYYTDQASTGSAECTIRKYNKNGTWKLITVALTEELISNKEGKSIEIQLDNQSKYVEFLVFPSQSYPMDPLEIREQRGKVSFNRSENVTIPGTEKTVFRFVSDQSLPLKQRSPYQFHLWELRKSGENLLSRLPDFPLIESLSPFSPKDTITSYIYL